MFVLVIVPIRVLASSVGERYELYFSNNGESLNEYVYESAIESNKEIDVFGMATFTAGDNKLTFYKDSTLDRHNELSDDDRLIHTDYNNVIKEVSNPHNGGIL